MAKFHAAIVAVAAITMVGVAFAGNVVEVAQKGKQFNPDEISIEAGTTIKFVNDDTVAHNVYSQDNGLEFNLGSQAPGDSKEIAFPKAGTFEIRCAIHPKMSLTVHVK